MKIYLVGGAVRDRLLELPVRERDWVVVGATEQQLLAAGYRRADREFPVFLHPDTGEEYALARTERKSGPGYRGFEVHAGPDVTLEQDLLRRDLTINALALDEQGELIDVCNGREDLEQGLLRHITPAFVEDPVRLLRVARFAAKLGQWGFRVAHGTHGLMQKMAASEDLLYLKAERLQVEMWKALTETQPWRFFEVLQRCGALAQLIPELARAMGSAGSHRTGSEADALAALKRVIQLSDDPAIRFAVVLGPLLTQPDDPGRLARRLRLTREAAEQLQAVQELAPLQAAACQPERLLQTVKRLKLTERPGRIEVLEQVGLALWPASMPALARNLRLAAEVLREIDVSELLVLGLQGPALGAALQARRLERLSERLSGESC